MCRTRTRPLVAKKAKKVKKAKKPPATPLQAGNDSSSTPRRITGPKFRKELAFVRTLAELRVSAPKKPAPRSAFRKKELDPEELATQATAQAEEDAVEAAAVAKRMAKYAALRSLYRTAELDSPAAPLLLVDGYNVIFASRRLARLARVRSLDLARERLVDEVGDFAVDRAMRAVVAFDAMGNPEGESCPWRRRTDLGGVEVVYCTASEADTFLVEEARRQRTAGAARVLIATDDLEIQDDINAPAEIAYLPSPMLLSEMRTAAREAGKRKRAAQWAWRAGNVQGVAELVRPWFAGQPPPLTDTLPPQSLGDPDSRWVCVYGVDLHYKEVGPADSKTAVLLIHGFNGSAWNWQGVMPAMAEAASDARVIAFDRPPFGISQRPLSWEGEEADNPYTSQGAARLALGLLDALGIEKAVVVGHSAGALVTMELFKRAPERVLGLVFVAPALPTNEPNSGPGGRKPSWQWQLRMAYSRALLQTEGPALHYVRGTLLKKAEEVRGGDLSGVFHDVTRATPEMIETYLRPLRSHDWDRGALLSFRAMRRPNALPYEAVTQPVLVVIGSQDSMLLKSTKKVTGLLQARPQGSTGYVELEACGHVPMQEQPDAFAAAVAPFIGEVVGAAAASPHAALRTSAAAAMAEQAAASAPRSSYGSGAKE
ncbi:hypothetical protein WJX81_003986 [Elliptochloris bilobata]|uniref:AB hydrolase-1 domain-containing protein n=1 Tax=Elliptochloris bilobata TaxID=381761 RepID=A0AAW1QKM8_9CHLO